MSRKGQRIKFETDCILNRVHQMINLKFIIAGTP